MFSSDVEDAFRIVRLIADVEEDETDNIYQKVKKNWEKVLAKSREEFIDLSLALTIRRSHHERVVSKKHLNNPIIVGKTREGNLIMLDGNHRLHQHIENLNEQIPAIILDISWLEDADDMEFDRP